LTRILLTGGRAPVTLELARLFYNAGHTVFVADSVPWQLCQTSKAVTRTFLLPPPNRQFAQFSDELEELVTREEIEWLIPTCEETFFVALVKPRINELCRVFTETIATLHPLHHKWHFILHAQLLGLPAPPTELVSSSEQAAQLIAGGQQLVFKPVYSRFATQTVICPTRPDQLPPISQNHPWVAQQYLPGRAICTYSVVHTGHITAHSAYAVEFTAGQGAAIYFKAEDHAPALNWVRRFMLNTRFTGQIAFDFIETGPDQVMPIECNPRATSGIHFFDSQLAEAFLDPNYPTLLPPAGQSAKLGLPMLLYGLPKIRSWAEFLAWRTAFFTSRDVVFSRQDPLPGLLSQWLSLAYFLSLSAKQRISPAAASTLDIEWNGEDIETLLIASRPLHAS